MTKRCSGGLKTDLLLLQAVLSNANGEACGSAVGKRGNCRSSGGSPLSVGARVSLISSSSIGPSSSCDESIRPGRIASAESCRRSTWAIASRPRTWEMHSRSVCHCWFPAYEHDLASYSLGSILLLELARWAADHGLATLDLGKGDDAYKQSFLSSQVPVAEGSIVRPSLAGFHRRLRDATESFGRRSPLAAPVRV